MPSIIRPSTRGALVAFVLLVASACAKQDEGPAVAETPARDPNTPLHVTSTGLSAPESVLCDSAHAVWYVSNSNGTSPQKDADGYIVRLGADGLAWNAARNAWMIVGSNTPDVFGWVIDAQEATVVGTGPGGGDGLVILGAGRAIYSSWADSSLTLFSGGQSTTLRTGLNAPADLGYDPVRRLLAVPLLVDDRVEFWPIDDAPRP